MAEFVTDCRIGFRCRSGTQTIGFVVLESRTAAPVARPQRKRSVVSFILPGLLTDSYWSQYE